MSPKKPRSAKEPTAKRPARKQLKATAEQVFKNALEAEYVALFPEITPLELAHLVAAMGLGDHDDGPSKALSLVCRSGTYIKGMKAQFERLNGVIAAQTANELKILTEMGLSPEAAAKSFSVDEVIARMPTDPLKIADKLLRGKDLWDEFRRQVNPQPGGPGKTREDGSAPEVYWQADLIRVYQEFKGWRDKIAVKNLAKGSKNLAKANRERKEAVSADGAEAVDALPLPKKRQ
jgi:hypothetical protein